MMMNIIGLLTFLLLQTRTSCQSKNDIQTSEDVVLANMTLEVATMDCAYTKVQLSNTDFILYNQQNQTNGIILNYTNLDYVNSHLRLIFIIHGWRQNGSRSAILAMKDAYLRKSPENVIIVNWSSYALLNYGLSVCSVPYVGTLVGDLIYNLTTNGYAQLENIQIIGFSLGAQVAGYTGKRVQNKTGGLRISKIIGLDAAGPGFEHRDSKQRLSSTDAVCVQAIHTSGGTFGFKHHCGTIDFEVNYYIKSCGAVQDGCPSHPGVSTSSNSILTYISCNHIRAVAYFTESINSTSFIGVACGDCASFSLRQCSFTSTAIMGEDFPCNVTGVYYLSTNAKSPFGKGSAGMKP